MNNIERIFEAVCNILSVYVSFKVTDIFLEKKRKLPFESRQGMGGKYERFSSKLRKFFTEISAHRF